MTGSELLQRALRRDRMWVALGLLAAVALTWAYLLAGAGMNIRTMTALMMPLRPHSWTTGYALIVLTMWAVMMAAMMLPSAAPMILLYTTIARRRRIAVGSVSAAGIFILAYFLVWAGFSVLATALQYAMERTALLSPMMQTTSVAVAGGILMAAGAYQWTPLKQACLRGCRSPLEFVMTRWREGTSGALRMGLEHGAYCVGCCWMLMLLLFVGGVMNIAWIAGIALFVLAEKVVPGGDWISRIAGLVLILWGASILVSLV